MIPLLLTAAAAVGTHLAYSSAVEDGSATADSDPVPAADRTWRFDIDGWLRQAGLAEVDRREFIAVVAALGVIGFLIAFVVFGALAPAAVVAGFAGSFPVSSYRRRRREHRRRAQEAWPRMIEEIRVQTSSLGRSIPSALFEVGRRGPEALRPSFAAAHREWLLTTDLARTLAVLKRQLSDPTADMACETLLIAHELGGTDLDRRLEDLAEDRLRDVQGRKDAQSRQAGARFARIFVLLVPGGMALAGMSIGNGRRAYQSGTGQVVVLVALAFVIGCWTWAGQIMRLPEGQRVFGDRT